MPPRLDAARRRGRAVRRAEPGQALAGARPQAPRRGGGGAAGARPVRRAGRGLPARSAGPAGARARGAPRTFPAARGLCALRVRADGAGPGAGRARPRLRGAGGAAGDGRARRVPALPGPAGRGRGRRLGGGERHPGRAARAGATGRGRLVDVSLVESATSFAALHLGPALLGVAGAAGGAGRARRRVCPPTGCTARRTDAGWRWPRWSRSSSRRCASGWGSGTSRPRRTAAGEAAERVRDAAGADLRRGAARGLEGAARRARRLRGAGAPAGRGVPGRAPPGPWACSLARACWPRRCISARPAAAPAPALGEHTREVLAEAGSLSQDRRFDALVSGFSETPGAARTALRGPPAIIDSRINPGRSGCRRARVRSPRSTRRSGRSVRAWVEKELTPHAAGVGPRRHLPPRGLQARRRAGLPRRHTTTRSGAARAGTTGSSIAFTEELARSAQRRGEHGAAGPGADRHPGHRRARHRRAEARVPRPGARRRPDRRARHQRAGLRLGRGEHPHHRPPRRRRVRHQRQQDVDHQRDPRRLHHPRGADRRARGTRASRWSPSPPTSAASA